jgi:hypothetical protein
MQESDTYLATSDEGQEKLAREAIRLFGEKRSGGASRLGVTHHREPPAGSGDLAH